ncbi:MAG: dihydroorotase [Chloroflexi bacterium RBG_13_46_9]|nr:MAG: dihydroorotase [Chloroflexi bacterium RBG_13_46_9]
MTNALLIKNARLLDPGQKIDRLGSILLRDGRIAWWGSKNQYPAGSRFDVLEAEGLVVCPGFIDLHSHLREPGFDEKETITSGAKAAARGGFTTICCMPNTKPPLDNIETINLVKTRADGDAIVRVLPIACVTKGRHGKELVDMEALAGAGIVGFSDDGDTVKTEGLMRQALINGNKLGLPIIDHCEDPIGGPPEGEVKIVERDLKLAEETGGWLHIAHVSTAGSTELIKRAKKKGVKVTSEVTPHHLMLTEDAVKTYGTLAKVNPPLRSMQDRDAMVKALKDGVIDCIATDHAPHTIADKAKGYSLAAPGISGFETAFGSLMGLVHGGKLTLSDLIYRLTTAPAQILGGKFGKLGSLVVGAVVDIVILDPEKEWEVDVKRFASKGENTPLNGTRLKGKVMATLSKGQIAYKDDSLDIHRANFNDKRVNE